MRQFLLFILGSILFHMANAQRSVSGKVTESNGGSAIQDITVNVKGTKTATTTLTDGTFHLENIPNNAILTFSSVNYNTVEYPLGTDSIIYISMVPTKASLDEVMVVAYGTAKKNSFTGSATMLTAKQIKDVPTTSFEAALNGKVPGLQFTQTSGQAGSASAIRIRGIGSMNASKDPLYVIDGVPVVSGNSGQMSDYNQSTNNIMNSLNPDDIESISVLKDAAASSLYGSRAANGVIIITTKKGKLGKPIIALKSTAGFSPSWATDNYEAAGVQEQVNMLYQVFHDYNTSAGKTDAVANADAIRRLNAKFNIAWILF